MIFPVLNGLLSYRRVPITWALVFMNVFVLLFSWVMDSGNHVDVESLFKDKSFLEVQGRIYQSYLRAQAEHQVKRDLASTLNDESTKSLQTFGALAFRDQKFLESKRVDSHFSDSVAFRYWKSKINPYLRDQAKSLGQILGVSSYSHDLLSWVSYMFAHASGMHLISNMIFLLIVGGTLELSLGSLGVLLIYLFSGFIAGGVFVLASGVSASPLVGASGAVSGLVTLLAVLNWKRPVRFFYWYLLPQRKAIGFVYLPGAFVFYLWIVTDLAGYLASTGFTGGVAYSAHLGGHLAGLCAGLGLLLVSKRKGPSDAESLPQMYELHPLFDEKAFQRPKFSS